jgi:predicted kinase
MKAYVTVGVSASGKTTFANELVKQGFRDINRDYIRFNIVCPGANWSNYKFNGKNEKAVTEIHEQMIMESWARGENIVISDTNLNFGRRINLIKTLQDLGYVVEIKEFHVTQDTAYKRDRLRANGVGEGVIYRQFKDYNDYVGRVTYEADTSLPKAIIFDVDGTIAEMNGRGPFEWKRVGEDKPRDFVIQMLRNYADMGYIIIICSGRDDICVGETSAWLDEHVGSIYWHALHMRKNGDFRKDNAVKEEIFWTHLAHRYNIVACVDDRPQMIRLWHELHIPNVIAVADPYIEF